MRGVYMKEKGVYMEWFSLIMCVGLEGQFQSNAGFLRQLAFITA